MPIDSPNSFARARAAAGVLFFDERDNVLMVVPSYKNYWDIPGGYLSHGETPFEAARREVKEELDVSPAIGRLLIADWSPTEEDGDKIAFIFNGGTLPEPQRNEIRLPPDELTAYQFVPLDEVPNRTIPRLARRITQAYEARDEPGPRYLERGELPT